MRKSIVFCLAATVLVCGLFTGKIANAQQCEVCGLYRGYWEYLGRWEKIPSRGVQLEIYTEGETGIYALYTMENGNSIWRQVDKRHPNKIIPPWAYFGNSRYGVKMESDGKSFYLFGKNSINGVKFVLSNGQLQGIAEDGKMACKLELLEKW
jgi:hypothetical protein